MSDPRDVLIRAVYEALTGDAALSAILADGGVYDHPPRAASFPFVSFGEGRTTILDADAVPTREHRFEVVVHSRAPGRREASDIAARVEALLTGGLVLSEGRLVGLRLRDTILAEGRDQHAYRARLRFVALTETD
ncbi:DUF3168 domain-containing protein [Acuticoccus sp. MNP-M23]|uniref:DUF3168 domain-containing protein n=1 Tax=Acuticoccus sp. MNP-M23 TaxID=3072793 RepID=UPI002815442F|nr:DUF3168 domain-containing protein [Acuticoccus sp. MNP-M23]WMS41695.1 DUF3168 domain-containing protein [Acuticoccus sp. MNP-M23]